ncbi:uncharacterized protein LOC143449497 isoform X2 [Clavelina lepadiformis]|uniref:uncharacterized protein LOC143449497 isoform X1 n=1 Tax=Clavelina lepadiformis TaxID=159417 RepID=UPI0040416912
MQSFSNRNWHYNLIFKKTLESFLKGSFPLKRKVRIMNGRFLFSLLVICFLAYSAECQELRPISIGPIVGHRIYFWRPHYTYRIIRICTWRCYCLKLPNPFTFQSSAFPVPVSSSQCLSSVRRPVERPRQIFETKA